MGELPRPLRWYIGAVYIATLLFVLGSVAHALDGTSGGQAILQITLNPIFRAALVFLALSYLGEHTTLHVTGGVSQSLSTAAHVAAILLFPAPLPLLVTLGGVAMSTLPQRERPFYKRLFNICHPTLTVGLSSLLCSAVANPDTVLQSGHFLAAMPCVLLLIASYYLLDVTLLLTVIALVQQERFWLVWWRTYRLTIVPELSASTIGILAAVAWRFDPLALSVVVLPVIALRLAFRAISQAQDRATALRRRGEQLEAVLQAGQRLRVQHTRADLLQTMAEAARSLAGADHVAGYLPDAERPSEFERTVLVPPVAVGKSPPYIPRSAIGIGISEVLEGTTRTLIIPLELEGKGILGLLRVYDVAADQSLDHHDALAILATQATIALQNSLLHERALAQASTDGLTDLVNHKRLQTRLEEEVARALRTCSHLTLLMIDLDDFRVINNSYGHQTGDTMLMAVAEVLRSNVRIGDVPARYGGDEFAVILPETPIEEGLRIAARIGAGIGALRVVSGGEIITLSASIGVAALPLHAPARDSLIRAADQAAYAAKQAGKGRVCRPEDAELSLVRDPAILAQRLEHANMAAVEALAAAVDAKDPYTQGHSQRVSTYAGILAEKMALGHGEVASIRLAGLLHDVGKIGVPDAILTKPGSLNEEEFSTIRQHSVIGERMLRKVPFLQEILPAVRHHHERWDGGGYPDGLREHRIPLAATVLMVADAYDAMTSSRTYRPALSVEEARLRMQAGIGSQFNPRVVTAFEEALEEGLLRLTTMNIPVAIAHATVPAAETDFWEGQGIRSAGRR